MEMHQVRYFLAVAETLNFTRAAELCHVAQPSLSRAVRKLEEELGGDLFRRERSQTHLTELGRSMMPVLQQCYDPGLFTNPLAVDFSACDASLVAGSFAAGESRVLPQLCDSHLRHERREEAAVEASGTATGDPAVA